MERVMVLDKDDLKKWVKEALQEYLASTPAPGGQKGHEEDALLTRKEIAAQLRVSLVTLTDWMKRGLPHHKQRGRVYFVKSEVMAYIRTSPFYRSDRR